MQSDFLAVDFGVKIGAPEAFIAGQFDSDEMKWRVADVCEAVLCADGEMRWGAGNEAHGDGLLFDLIARGEGNGATRQADERNNDERAAAETPCRRESQSRKILPMNKTSSQRQVIRQSAMGAEHERGFSGRGSGEESERRTSHDGEV